MKPYYEQSYWDSLFSWKELEYLINYYINNETERNKIGKEGRDYCLNYHKFSDRVAEVLSSIQK